MSTAALPRANVCCFQRQMGVFYDVRAHIAESQDDYTGKKGSTVGMGIRKVRMTQLLVRLKV